MAFFDKRKALSDDGLVLTNPLGNFIVERSYRQSSKVEVTCKSPIGFWTTFFRQGWRLAS